MVYVNGTAHIRHAQSGQVYEIDADMLDFESVSSEERSMGPETAYSAVVEHPELGQLTWSIWEYPIGAENYRETDVGPHELLNNLEFGLEHEPPDPDEDGDERIDEEDRQAQIDALVEWFFERYEDPAQRLPYISAEGGYQWIYGGPYDAREELAENFPDLPDDVIEAAVDEIESDGLTDWAPVASAEDYDQYEDNEPDDLEVSAIARDLEDLIQGLPEAVAEPAFEVGGDGLIHMAIPPDATTPDANNPLLDELREATQDLLHELNGTNAHTDLLNAVQRYHATISADSISISQVYSRGIRLANVGEATEKAIARDYLPSFPLSVEAHLSSVLDLNRAYIMAHPEGRRIAENSAAYQRTPSDTEAMRRAADDFADAVASARSLFADDVRERVVQASSQIGHGPQPGRSNQNAAHTFGNLTRFILKQVGTAALFTGAALGGAAITGSIPGGALAATGTEYINLCWSFLVANASALHAIAASFGADLSWMSSAAHILERHKAQKPDS